MNEKTLSFSLQRKEVPVTLDNEEYVIVELDGRERDKYLGTLGKRTRFDKDGKPAGLKDFDGIQASLLTLSLYKLGATGREAVDAKTIQSWPSSVVSDLFDIAKDLSGIEVDEDEEGND